jgi:hypothetical protein
VPGRWTSKRVEDVLVAAFLALPDTPIFSPAKNVLCTTEDGRLAPGPIKAIAWTSRYLKRESRERLALLMWARHKALPVEALDGILEQMNWQKRTFYRQRKRALRLVCEGLHRDRVPLFDVEWHLIPRRNGAARQPGLGMCENGH